MSVTVEKLEVGQTEIESLARCLLPDILSFFESEAGKHEFEEWQKRQTDK